MSPGRQEKKVVSFNNYHILLHAETRLTVRSSCRRTCPQAASCRCSPSSEDSFAAWQRQCDVRRIRSHKCASDITVQCLLRNRSVACSSVLSFFLFCNCSDAIYHVILSGNRTRDAEPFEASDIAPTKPETVASRASCFHWVSFAVKCSILMLSLPSGVESLLSVIFHLPLPFLYDLPLVFLTRGDF